jgi:hypothetical protein
MAGKRVASSMYVSLRGLTTRACRPWASASGRISAPPSPAGRMPVPAVYAAQAADVLLDAIARSDGTRTPGRRRTARHARRPRAWAHSHRTFVADACGSRSISSADRLWLARAEARPSATVVFPTPPFWFADAYTSTSLLPLQACMRAYMPEEGAAQLLARRRRRYSRLADQPAGPQSAGT